MSIVTKRGDKGMTTLYGGRNVPKDHAMVEAYGTLDELISYLGVAKSLMRDSRMRKMVESVQEDLFLITSELSCANYIKQRMDASGVRRIENVIAWIERERRLKARSFAVPGMNFVSSILDVSRTVARRCERRIVTLKRRKMLKNGAVIIYVNRLSDLLFLLARLFDKAASKTAR